MDQTPPIEPDDSEILVIHPQDSDQGQRLDALLTKHIPDLSRTRIQALIRSGCVRCGEEIFPKPSCRIETKQPLTVLLPPPLDAAVIPENLQLEILFEDDYLAVVNKPCGMPTHPTTTQTTGTLVNALLYHLSNLSGIGGVLRPGIVHRLDRVTSGLLVVAKTHGAHLGLAEAFNNRTVTKTYRAIAVGRDPGPAGDIQAPIARHTTHRERMTTNPAGRPALTIYRRIAATPPAYGMELDLHTGRTHQIRVHLENLGLAIVLDERYGFDWKQWPWSQWRGLLKHYPGIFLHAELLGFQHPITNQPLQFVTPPPQPFQQLWTLLFEPERQT